MQKEGLGIEFRLQLVSELYLPIGSDFNYHFSFEKSPPAYGIYIISHPRSCMAIWNLYVQAVVSFIHWKWTQGNILIDNDGVARLCDFGLAHLVSDADVTATATSNVGTIRYAAPELRRPEDDDENVRASTQTDIYSLACIAYEVCCHACVVLSRSDGV